MSLAKITMIGLTLALSIGPISLLIAQRGIAKGMQSAMVTAVGVALADFALAIIAGSIGASALLFLKQYEGVVQVFSGMVLLIVALSMLISALRRYGTDMRTNAARGRGNDFLSAFVLTIHNPMTIVIFLGFLSYMTWIQSLTDVVLFAFFLFLGSLAGQVAIGLTASVARLFFQSPKSILTLNIASAIGIAIFAVMSFLKALQ